MIAKSQLSLALLSGMCVSINAMALQTPSSLFGELVQDVTVISQLGTCNSNPYPTDPSTQAPLNPPCAPAVVTCPSGKTPLSKGLVACDVLPSAKQSELAQIMTTTINGQTLATDPASLNHFKTEAFNATRKAQCSPGISRMSTTGSGELTGYTPWCFYKRAGKPLSTASWYPDFYVGGTTSNMVLVLSDGTKLSTADTNNPLNWYCYPIDIKVTARCVTAPGTAGLNRLGIQLK